jgi:hypothetical protein
MNKNSTEKVTFCVHDMNLNTECMLDKYECVPFVFT